MRIEDKKVGQIVVVVSDIEKTVKNYCDVFGIEQPEIKDLPKKEELPVYYNGRLQECTGRICVFDFSGIIFEVMEPGAEKSVWRDYLEKYGEGVFDIGFWVDGRKECFSRFKRIGVEPNHVGFFDDGSYSIMNAKEALGMQINIHCHTEDFEAVLRHPPKLLSDTNY
ncbi:MAG: VOC family protein [Lachnospiraceae bacterium]